jgi:protein SCO1/2
VNRGSLASLAVVVALGAVFLWWSTDELRAFTSEGARRLEVARHPRDLPEALLTDQDGTPFRLADLKGRWVVVEFVYTRCVTVCSALGNSFERIARRLPPGRLGGDVILLSVSFDPANDDRAALGDFAGRYVGAGGPGWRVARVADGSQLAALLSTFGVVVVPDGAGGFEHNAALHVVDPRGRLSRIHDVTAADQVLAELGGGA